MSLALAATALVLCAAPAARAADQYVIGSQNLSEGGSTQICAGSPCTVMQGQFAAASAGAYTVRSPVAGTIVSWSYRTANALSGDRYALRVLRPTNASETQFTAVATRVSPSLATGMDLVLGAFPVSVAVNAGDRIGLQSRGPTEFGVPIKTTSVTGPAGDGVSYFLPDIPDGGTPQTPYGAGSNNGQQVLVQATVQTGPPPPLPPETAPQPPDFRVVFSPPRSSKLPFTIPRGGSLDIPMTVQRLNGSRGQIALRVTGVPKGLKATLSSTTIDNLSDTPIFVRFAPRTPSARAKPGSYKVRVVGTPSSADTAPAERTLLVSLNVLGEVAVKVEGIEVNQSVQTFEQPYGGAYYGVPLMDGKKTIARVFADFAGVTGKIRGRARLPQFGMALYGYDPSGRQLPLSPLVPDWSPQGTSLSLNDDGLTAAERIRADDAFTFELPKSWSIRSRKIRLTAVALGSDLNLSAAALCVSTSCGASPTTTLPGVEFQKPPAPKVFNAVGVLAYDPEINKYGTFPDISQFARLQAMSPIPIQFMGADNRRSAVPRYRAQIVAPAGRIWETTRDYDDAQGHPGDYTVGAFHFPRGGGGGIAPGPRTAVGEDTPSRVVVAHEAFHLLGFRHADSVCGGGGGGFPEPTGRMRSVGMDTSGSAPFPIIPDTVSTPGFDLMSYCAGNYNSWISDLNWRRAIDPSAPRARPAEPRLRSVPRAAGATLDVQARIDNGVGRILSVGPALGPVPAPTPGSPYQLVARDAAGAVVSSTPMAMEASHVDGTTGAAILLDGAVPAAGVSRVEVLSGSTLVAARDRTPNAPQVAVLSPKAGSRVGGKGPVTVTWRASDSDAGQREAALDYSADGGRTFAQVFSGPDAGSARLPAEVLTESGDARLRLRVNDGFNEGEATSTRFSVVARPPQVTITSPVSREIIRPGSIVNLAGGAQDDHGRAIVGNSLRWFAGRRLLGRGENLTRTFSAGTREVRLVAVDRAGHVGSGTVKVRVPASTPFFLQLKAPGRLSRRARRLVLVVAATQPGTLRIGGRRFSIGRSPRRIRLSVAAGRRPLRVSLILAAGGGRNRQLVVVPRR
jgi:hypothetical protein